MKSDSVSPSTACVQVVISTLPHPQQDVGMMALLLGQFANAIHESQGGLKVGKLVGAHDVMLVDDIPLRGLR